jgi:hypothetical protein
VANHRQEESRLLKAPDVQSAPTASYTERPYSWLHTPSTSYSASYPVFFFFFFFFFFFIFFFFFLFFLFPLHCYGSSKQKFTLQPQWCAAVTQLHTPRYLCGAFCPFSFLVFGFPQCS